MGAENINTDGTEHMKQVVESLHNSLKEFLEIRAAWAALGEAQGLELRGQSIMGVFERAVAVDGIPPEIFLAVRQEGDQVTFVQYRLVGQRPDVQS